MTTSDSTIRFFITVDAALLLRSQLGDLGLRVCGPERIGRGERIQIHFRREYGAVSFQINPAREPEQRQPGSLTLQLHSLWHPSASPGVARLFRVTRGDTEAALPAGDATRSPAANFTGLAPAG